MEKLTIPTFDQSTILVYGDLMLDRYWHGNTSRVSPEAPVPIVEINQMETRPGGAANVAMNIAALGAGVSLFGCLGDDAEGRELTAILKAKQVDCQCLILPEYATTTKLRILSQNQQLIRLDFEKKMGADNDLTLIENFQKFLPQAQVAVFSDYAKGTLHQIAHCIQLAKKQNLFVLVDPKQNDFSHYRDASVITPNRKEFEAIVGICHSNTDLIEKGHHLIDTFNLGALLITLGKDGMILLQRQKTPMTLAAHAREVYDVTGAGDTVIGVLAATLAAGASLEKAARLANLAASLVVRKLGAATVSINELQAALSPRDIDNGIITEDQLLTAVCLARSKGEVIVMTNGCFDLLHAGHVEYLKAAKELGDRLIVAVNDDASVRHLKGNNRPINPLAARMEVLAALEAVDWVVPFHEITPANLISRVLPDILVKGGDYQPNTIAGHEAVLAQGGKVLVLPFKAGYSSSKILALMGN